MHVRALLLLVLLVQILKLPSSQALPDTGIHYQKYQDIFILFPMMITCHAQRDTFSKNLVSTHT
jgi:hypothetical protein